MTGEYGPCLEEEVILLTAAMGSALDDLDHVDDAFHNTGVQGVTAT